VKKTQLLQDIKRSGRSSQEEKASATEQVCRILLFCQKVTEKAPRFGLSIILCWAARYRDSENVTPGSPDKVNVPAKKKKKGSHRTDVPLTLILPGGVKDPTFSNVD